MALHDLPRFIFTAALLGACTHNSYGSTGSSGSTGDTDTSSTGSSSGSSSTGAGSTSTDSGGASAEGSGTTTTTTSTTTSSTTTGEDGDTDGTSTGPAVPICGDGKIDPGETCDDGNDDPDDGCKFCAADLRVFVTSKLFQGGGIGGLYLADQRCRMLAAVAGLPNFANYRAWLSDSSESAETRIFHSPGRYVLVNGLVVAEDWDDLTSGQLKHSINVTELSQTSLYSPVWTGTYPTGKPAWGNTFCDDWTAHNKQQKGGFGVSSEIDWLWSFYDDIDCGAEATLYCFENPTKV